MRQVVDHFLLAVFAGNEIVHHAALNGARTIERVQRAQVLNALRPVAPQDVLHAAGFKLEYAGGVALVEDLDVRELVIQRDLLHHDALAVNGLDQLQRVIHNRQRRQAQKVHLQQAQFFQSAHVVLGDNFVLVRLVKRNKVPERFR